MGSFLYDRIDLNVLLKANALCIRDNQRPKNDTIYLVKGILASHLDLIDKSLRQDLAEHEIRPLQDKIKAPVDLKCFKLLKNKLL